MRPPETIASGGNLHIVTVGSFGRAVKRYLLSFFPDLAETVWDGAAPPAWPDSRIQILAAWRPVPGLSDRLDEFVHTSRRPLIPLIIDAGTLRLGPVIIPGVSGCWRCWEMRSQQHDTHRKTRADVARFYEENAEAGPKGYFEPMAMIGAVRIAETLEDLASNSESIAGRIWQMNLFTRVVSTGRLIGVGDCPRCGLNRPLETRTYLDVRRELAFLWTGAHDFCI